MGLLKDKKPSEILYSQKNWGKNIVWRTIYDDRGKYTFATLFRLGCLANAKRWIPGKLEMETTGLDY